MYRTIKKLLLGIKCVHGHKELHMFDLKLNINNFHTLEVVGRGSETQLQVCENLRKIT